ncbi:MAG: hypothetical protein IT372_27115 [Polyangiaceae bacterium]|nr:hypothetical protein [Polyangiaceae bacterium]
MSDSTITTPPVDRHGHALTCAPEAADHYREGLDRLLGLAEGAADCFEEAISIDDRFHVAHAALALTHLVDGRPARARAAMIRAREALAGRGRTAAPVTRRERWHAEIISAGVRGEHERARDFARAHLQEFPRDLTVFAYLVFDAQEHGDPADRADLDHLAATLAPHYDDDWAFLALRAAVLDDLGRVDEALPLALRALDLRPDCAVAAHVLAHARFERCEHEEGRRFLAEWLREHAPSLPALVHLTWHQAMFDLALLDARAALERYERWIRPAALAGVPGALIAAASLLWRLALDGRDATAAFRDIHRQAALAVGGTGSPYADLHVALALAGSGDVAALDRLAGTQQARACRGDAAAGGAVLPIALGLRALIAGESHAAAAHLEIGLSALDLIPGGRAQRRLIEDTLIEACLRAGRAGAAERRLRARMTRRATARDLVLLDRAVAAGSSSVPACARRPHERLTEADRAAAPRSSSSRRGLPRPGLRAEEPRYASGPASLDAPATPASA